MDAPSDNEKMEKAKEIGLSQKIGPPLIVPPGTNIFEMIGPPPPPPELIFQNQVEICGPL